MPPTAEMLKLLKQHATALKKGRALPPLLNQLRWLHRSLERRRAFFKHLVPDLLVAAQEATIERATRAVQSELDGRGLYWTPLEGDARPRVIDPPRERAFETELTHPIDVAFTRGGLLVQTPTELLQVDGEDMKRQPLADCSICCTSADGRHVLFKCMPELAFAIYDAQRRAWGGSLELFPAVHVNSAVAAWMSVVDLHRQKEAHFGATDPGEASGFVLSPDGRWLWSLLTPAYDDLGVVEVERGAPVFDPWPKPGRKGREWYDESLRAIVRRPDGTFLLLHGNQLLRHDVPIARIEGTYRAAAFNLDGTQLALADDSSVRTLSLDSKGRPATERVVKLPA